MTIWIHQEHQPLDADEPAIWFDEQSLKNGSVPQPSDGMVVFVMSGTVECYVVSDVTVIDDHSEGGHWVRSVILTNVQCSKPMPGVDFHDLAHRAGWMSSAFSRGVGGAVRNPDDRNDITDHLGIVWPERTPN
jgi:hypothetical protein